MDSVGSGTDLGVAVPRQLETLALSVQCMPSYDDFVPDILIPDSLHCLMQLVICIDVQVMPLVIAGYSFCYNNLL